MARSNCAESTKLPGSPSATSALSFETPRSHTSAPGARSRRDAASIFIAGSTACLPCTYFFSGLFPILMLRRAASTHVARPSRFFARSSGAAFSFGAGVPSGAVGSHLSSFITAST